MTSISFAPLLPLWGKKAAALLPKIIPHTGRPREGNNSEYLSREPKGNTTRVSQMWQDSLRERKVPRRVTC